jgi:hypothetical protein
MRLGYILEGQFATNLPYTWMAALEPWWCVKESRQGRRHPWPQDKRFYLDIPSLQPTKAQYWSIT